jgi:hypothetical protein
MTDTPPEFDLFTALANQAEVISARVARLSALKRAVDCHKIDWMEWLLLFAAAADYRPDLIVEIGRSRGNSTCALTEAAMLIDGCRVRSYDVDGERAYETVTLPAIRPLVSPDWLGRQEIIHQDFTYEHPDDLLRDGRRVLVFWDAHGPAVARHMLSRIAPALATREHLILVHDILDARYVPVSHEYVTPTGHHNCWRGHLVSDCEELDPIFDFVSRNGIQVNTAGQSAWRRCPEASPGDVVATAARRIVGSTLDLFPDAQSARLASFSCHERSSTRLVFPPADNWDRVGANAGGRTADTTSVALDLAQFQPSMGTIGAAPDGGVRIVTPPLIWGYAATMALPPHARGGGGAPSGAVRVRAEVTDGTAAIGVTAWDGKSFVDRRFVWPSGKVVEVFLHLPQLSVAGDLVVQTWDEATSATVRIESATLIVR